MATSDVRDILDVKATESRPPKKQKVVARRPDNIPKEVFGLLGERAPPVVLQPEKYQRRPKFTRKAQPWEQQSFTNPSRTDGLVLKHWARKPTLRPATPGGPATPADKNEASESKSTQIEAPTHHWTKYDTKVTGPEYTDEQYEVHLKSDKWTKEETDYLIQLALDFDLRWVVIADRYDFQSGETGGNGDFMAVTKPRSMEDMKVRYYEVASKMIPVHQPPLGMSNLDFALLETMKKFDPIRETTRKKLAEALLARSADEIKEEELLLTELKRIVVNEDHFLQEREELFNRLEHPVSQGSIAMYESSAGLVQLMQTLLAADKNKKRRSTAGGDPTSSPAQPAATPSTAGPGRDHRASVSGPHPRKSLTATGSNARQLSARDEAKYGVAHHERLSSGVTFRQTRIEKLVLAKSAAQNQKLQEGLAELGIPSKAVMPTSRVCAEYEKVVAGIQTLLDARKVGEKVGNEIRILRAQREGREQQTRGNSTSELSKIGVEKGGVEKGPNESRPAGITAQTTGFHSDGGGDSFSKGEDVEMKDDKDDENQAAEANKTSDAEMDEEHSDEQDDEPDDEADVDEDEDEAEVEQEVAETDNSVEEQAVEPQEEEEEEDDNDDDEDEDEDEDNEEGDEEELDENEGEIEEEGEGPNEEDAANGSRAASFKGIAVHKRSASVFSAMSERSNKKQRK